MLQDLNVIERTIGCGTTHKRNLLDTMLSALQQYKLDFATFFDLRWMAGIKLLDDMEPTPELCSAQVPSVSEKGTVHQLNILKGGSSLFGEKVESFLGFLVLV